MFFILLLLSAPSFASETRLSIDPTVDLDQLRSSGQVTVRVDRDGSTFRSDASAVLPVDEARLIAAAEDYDHYVAMGMPQLRESHLVARSGNTLEVWAWMSFDGQTSKHYLEVTALPSVGNGEGASWVLTHRESGWPYADSPAFSQLDGSFYVETLSPGQVYCRYFLAATIDSVIPGFLLNLVAGKVFHDGVQGVVEALDKAAR
jgi:hypothetical protein